MGHTKGPWRYDSLEGAGARTWTITKKGIYLADIYQREGKGEANASRIAAAPELLGACREMEQLISAHIPEEAHNRCRLARTAIAKAEGGGK